MGKPFKIILALFGALFLLVVAVAIALPLWFNPNDFRVQIAEAVKNETGRDFAVGEVKLSVFPWLRVNLSDVTLGNAAGFGTEPMLTVKRAEIGSRLLPLLREKRIEASRVQFEGVVANLAVNAEGRSNWQDLIKPTDPAAAPLPPIAERLKKLDIEGVTLSDVRLSYDDRQAGKKYLLDELQLKTGRLQGGAPFAVDTRFKAAALEATAVVEFEALVAFDAASGDVDLSKTRLKFDGARAGAAPMAIAGSLKTEALKYLSAKQNISVGSLLLTIDKLTTGAADQPTLSAKAEVATHLDYDMASGRASLSATKLSLDAKKAGITPLAVVLSLQGDSLIFDNSAQTLNGSPLALVIDSLVVGAADKPLLTAKGQLKTVLAADLDKQLHRLDGLSTELQLGGSALPGGKPQTINLAASIAADLAQQQLKINGLQLLGMGLKASANQWLVSKLGSDLPTLAGDLALANFAPRALLAILGIEPPKTADATVLKSASLTTQFTANAKSAALSKLTLKLDETTLRGDFAIRNFSSKAISFALKADQLNADRYLPPPVVAASEISTAKPADKAALNAVELPIKALEELNAQGTLDVASMRLKNLKLGNVRLKLDGAAGATKRQQLSADLYGGSADLNLAVAAGAKQALKLTLSQVNAGTLLQDFLKSDKLSGKANMVLDVTSAGRTIGEVRRALNGSMNFKITDGAVKGFNLGKVMRDGQALLLSQAAPSAEPQATDFAELTGSGVFVNGVLKSDQLNAKNPFLRLEGKGEIDLVNEAINYLATPTLVNTASGQGGKELAGLSRIAVPIRLTGDLYRPKVTIDWKAALKQQAVTELREKFGVSEETVREKRNELRARAKEEISKGLFKLLGGKPAAAPPPDEPTKPEPAPAPAPAP